MRGDGEKHLPSMGEGRREEGGGWKGAPREGALQGKAGSRPGFWPSIWPRVGCVLQFGASQQQLDKHGTKLLPVYSRVTAADCSN